MAPTPPTTPGSPTTAHLDIEAPDGVADAYLVTVPGAPPAPGVLFYMDAFGLRPRLEEMAGHIAAQGYAVLVPNVFYRDARSPVVEMPTELDAEARKQVFDTVGPMMATLTPEAVARDAGAYLEALAGDDRVADGPVGATGYCMGGALVLRTAAHAPDRVAAAASFHGGRLATEDQQSPHLLLDRVSAEVYAGHADDDPSMPPEQQQRLEDALTGAGLTHRCELYEGAAHGFTMADTAAYDEQATGRHWDRLLDLFARTL